MTKRQRQRRRHTEPTAIAASELASELRENPIPPEWLEAYNRAAERLTTAMLPAAEEMRRLGITMALQIPGHTLDEYAYHRGIAVERVLESIPESESIALYLSTTSLLNFQKAKTLVEQYGSAFAAQVGRFTLQGWDCQRAVEMLLAQSPKPVAPYCKLSRRQPSTFIEVCGETNVGRHQTPCTACRNHNNNPYLKCAMWPLGHPEGRCIDWEEIPRRRASDAIASRHFDIHCEGVADMQLQNYRLILDAEYATNRGIPTDGSSFSATVIYHSRSIRLHHVRFLMNRYRSLDPVFECLPAPGSTGFQWLIIDDPAVELPYDSVRADFYMDCDREPYRFMFDTVGNQLHLSAHQVRLRALPIERNFSIVLRLMGRSLYLDNVRFREFLPEAEMVVFDCLYSPGQCSPYRWL